MLFCREYHVCGASVEVQYYAPEGYIDRGRRVSMKHVCCHCYDDSQLKNNNNMEARE